MYGMFWEASKFNQDISDWDVNKVTDNIKGMFDKSGLEGNEPSWYKAKYRKQPSVPTQ